MPTFFHATPVDLTGQTHLEPPSVTGREPTWDDMDPSELDLVFLTDTLDAARGWGADIAGCHGDPFTVYEVEAPAATRSGPPGMYVAPRAQILRVAFIYDPTE